MALNFALDHAIFHDRNDADSFYSLANNSVKVIEDHQTKLNEGEEKDVCDRCNGFTQIEQGGNIVDCYACNGSGEKSS